MSTIYTKEKTRSLKNNDPLAHVYLLQDSFDGVVAEHRMRTEFITDMGERIEHQPFKGSYIFNTTAEEIVYVTGLAYIASLRQSFEAAKHDVASGGFIPYHAARQAAFLRQGEKVLEWANDTHDRAHLVLFSLCPPHDELSYTDAKKQNFKPDRQMASVQLHAKYGDGSGETVAFSLDGLTLGRLQKLLEMMGVEADVADTTLEQLVLPVRLAPDYTAAATVAAIIEAYDGLCQEEEGGIYTQGINLQANIVEANAFVDTHPETFALYKTIITEVARSLQTGITPELADTVEKQLVRQFTSTDIPPFLRLQAGDILTERTAAEVIEYLRKRAIPEYLMQMLQQRIVVEDATDGMSLGYDIGSAGASAMAAGRSYDGACPGSVTQNNLASVDNQAKEMGLLKVAVYESPKPLFSKGDFEVVPIGSCPVCGAECGTGIRHKKSGKWYCTQLGCKAFEQAIYDFVFAIAQDMTPTRVSPSLGDAELIDTSPKKVLHPQIQIHTLNQELKQMQTKMWLLQNTLYDEELSEAVRTELITDLIQTYQEQQTLLRISLGYAAIS